MLYAWLSDRGCDFFFASILAGNFLTSFLLILMKQALWRVPVWKKLREDSDSPWETGFFQQPHEWTGNRAFPVKLQGDCRLVEWRGVLVFSGLSDFLASKAFKAKTGKILGRLGWLFTLLVRDPEPKVPAKLHPVSWSQKLWDSNCCYFKWD